MGNLIQRMCAMWRRTLNQLPMKTKPRSGKRVVKAWAVVDMSGALGRKPYIDVNPDWSTFAIHFSKYGGIHHHKDFKGKVVVPCEISFTLPTPKKGKKK